MPVGCVQGCVSFCRAVGWSEPYKPVSFFFFSHTAAGGVEKKTQTEWHKIDACAQPNENKTETDPQKQAAHTRHARRRGPRRQPVRSLPSPALQSSSCRQASASDICNIHTFYCHASHHHVNCCTSSARGTVTPREARTPDKRELKSLDTEASQYRQQAGRR